MFGLKEAEVAPLVRAVAGGDLDREAIEDRFARATWSGIAEPGDRIAGELIDAIGASSALLAIIEQVAPDELLAQLGSNAAISRKDLKEGMDRWSPRLTSGAALVSLRQAARYGVRLCTPDEPDWPSGMHGLGAQGPLALWVRGVPLAYKSLSTSIALVGARAATGYGEHVTMEASAGLVDRGYTIVSGAAYGIDGMAHRAALASHGLTVAFLAGGVDRFYPAGHDALLERIVQSGAVISELPCGSAPTKWRFLQRNRLIAAASLATVVLEAGWRSGSLNTAHHALEVGRALGAVPGPVTSAASAGCHKLLREGQAICVTGPDEMAELAPLGELNLAPQPPRAPDSTVTRVLDALSTHSARPAADIAARSGLSVADAQSVLGRLELDGTVRQTERGWRRA